MLEVNDRRSAKTQFWLCLVGALWVLFLRFLFLNTLEENPLIYTDSHPKNILTDGQGNWALIDFGRTVYGDPDYVLPNFVAHILMNYTIARVDESAIGFIADVIEGYHQTLRQSSDKAVELDQEKFCFYLAAEILNRRSGKWVDYFSPTDPNGPGHTSKLTTLGMTLINDRVRSIREAISIAGELRDFVSYDRNGNA